MQCDGKLFFGLVLGFSGRVWLFCKLERMWQFWVFESSFFYDGREVLKRFSLRVFGYVQVGSECGTGFVFGV